LTAWNPGISAPLGIQPLVLLYVLHRRLTRPEAQLTALCNECRAALRACEGAAPRRRSYTPTRRLGACGDEGSGIWMLLLAKVTD
jgi:hypothetical protein